MILDYRKIVNQNTQVLYKQGKKDKEGNRFMIYLALTDQINSQEYK